MTLPTDLPTDKVTRGPGHPAGHNATNTRVNAIAAEVNAHEAATTDPHADRAYTDTQVAAAAARLAVSVAGSSDVTLTAAQIRARSIDLTGATQTITVIFPAATFECEVCNSSNYDLSIKRSGSSTSLTLHAGAIVKVQG